MYGCDSYLIHMRVMLKKHVHKYAKAVVGRDDIGMESMIDFALMKMLIYVMDNKSEG